MKTDVVVSKHGGSLFLFSPMSDEAIKWLETNTWGTWYGGALVVEHRFAIELAQTLLDHGFRLA